MLKDKSSKIEKVVVNIGVGRMSQTPNFDDKVLPEVIREASMILGQRPQTRRKNPLPDSKPGRDSLSVCAPHYGVSERGTF